MICIPYHFGGKSDQVSLVEPWFASRQNTHGETKRARYVGEVYQMVRLGIYCTQISLNFRGHPKSVLFSRKQKKMPVVSYRSRYVSTAMTVLQLNPFMHLLH